MYFKHHSDFLEYTAETASLCKGAVPLARARVVRQIKASENEVRQLQGELYLCRVATRLRRALMVPPVRRR